MKIRLGFFFFFAIESSLKISFFLSDTYSACAKTWFVWCNSGRRKCLWRQLWALLYDRKLHESDFINFVNENEKQSANGIFWQVICAWCESYGHWWRHHLSSLILHNCMVSMENHQEFSFKLLMITYILHGCNTMMRISEGNTVCCLSLF